MDKNSEALALAFKKAKAKSKKIKELNITPDMSAEALEELIIQLSKEKAEQSGESWTQFVKGQEWYVNHLVHFAELDAKQRLEEEYEQCFASVASEAELIAKLEEEV